MKRASVFLTAATLLAAGCGSKATITGTVTYKDQPIHEGNIVFTPESGGRSVGAVIKDGKYTAEKVPTGPAKVTVTSMYAQGAGGPQELTKKMGGPPADAPLPPEARAMMERRSTMASESKKGVKIPDHYADPEKSGLTYTVEAGPQTKDFKLQ
jgi:hypothetical protein